MSSPLPPVPGETPEQRQARLNAAYAVQARIDKERRDEEARRAVPVAVPQAATKSANPFDPNAALRDFNQYFGTLRKQHGDAGLRAMGFSPSDLARMQADLRKLQLDPNSTPEQHRQAYQQARDTLAQRLTMPIPQPMAEPAPPFYAEYLSSLNNRPVTPPPTEVVVAPTQTTQPLPPVMMQPVAPQPDISKYIAEMNAPVVAPGGSTNFNEATGVYTKPGDPLMDALKNAGQVAGGAPSGGMGMLGSMAPAVPAPTPTFDRNAALQQLNQSFANLRNTYGVDALRGAGFAPSNLSALQADLRKLQLDNSSTQEQHTAALQNALNTMNSFTNNLKPITPSQTGMALPMTQPQTGMALPMAQPQTGMALPMTPAPQPTPPPPNVQGMYRGGFAVKR